jgi:signal transduction histidine kinase
MMGLVEPEHQTRWWPGWIAPEDPVWFLLFAAMIVFSPEPSPAEYVFLPLLAAIQILEPKFPALSRGRGILASIFLKLLFGYLLVGFTGGLNSAYYLVFLLPVVTGATAFGRWGAVGNTLLSCGAYLSFALFVNWERYTIEPADLRRLCLRVTFMILVGYLTHGLAEASRREQRRYQQAASQLREAEATVRRTERLAALGQLTAGLAHELRNPIGTIKASAEMLARSLSEENAIAREMAGFISSEVDRTNALITRFLEFARPTPLRMKTAELAEVIDRAVAQIQRLHASAGVNIYTNYSPDIPPFLMDAEILERIVYNLLLNAVQASPPGGTVTVKTKPLNGMVEISVIDRGAGIPPEQVENIFNPFFTTKPDGVGLGLAIVSKLVDEHGGAIAVESEPGRGSVFVVRLPVRRSETS